MLSLEEKKRLAEIYNESDIEAFHFMEPFCDGIWLEVLNRVVSLNMETDIGWGRESATAEEVDEYFKGKWELLFHFGLVEYEEEAYVAEFEEYTDGCYVVASVPVNPDGENAYIRVGLDYPLSESEEWRFWVETGRKDGTSDSVLWSLYDWEQKCLKQLFKDSYVVLDPRIAFEEKFEVEDGDGTKTSLYYTAPAELLSKYTEEKYPDAESMEICLEFPKDHIDAEHLIECTVSPTKEESEYDWIEVSMFASEVTKLIELAKHSM